MQVVRRFAVCQLLCDGVPVPRAARPRAFSFPTDTYMTKRVVASSVVSRTSVGCRDWRGAASAFGCHHSGAGDDKSWLLA